ncbi:MAG TPA: DUF1634 domain-containing protein [Candidatus Sulfotelmatobacter sp.]|nr:DUF1634 domain-containing protein [Candidatus Sulfotelmatobacter sp.]
MQHGRGWGDQRIEEIVGNLLRAGVTLAASVVFVGAVIYLIRHGGAVADYRAFQEEPLDLRSVGGILRDAIGLRGRGVIQFGLLLLIATPVARVAFSIFGFAKERDRMYVAFTTVVLVVLLYSLFGPS